MGFYMWKRPWGDFDLWLVKNSQQSDSCWTRLGYKVLLRWHYKYKSDIKIPQCRKKTVFNILIFSPKVPKNLTCDTFSFSLQNFFFFWLLLPQKIILSSDQLSYHFNLCLVDHYSNLLHALHYIHELSGLSSSSPSAKLLHFLQPLTSPQCFHYI